MPSLEEELAEGVGADVVIGFQQVIPTYGMRSTLRPQATP